MMPEQIENRMVVDAEWIHTDSINVKTILEEKGYHELGTGTFVPEKDAYEYALEHCLYGSEQEQRDFKELLVEWFYSGNWIKEG